MALQLPICRNRHFYELRLGALSERRRQYLRHMASQWVAVKER